MKRRVYSNPPVHEVILDLQLADGADIVGLTRGVPHALEELLGEPRMMMQMEISGSAGEPSLRGGPSIGWEFRGPADDPWVVRAAQSQVTYHAMRAGDWPTGTYVGWETISARYAQVHSRLTEFYSQVPIRRAGLRYLNRVAVPYGKELDAWFTLHFESHPLGRRLRTFSLHQVWENVDGFEDIGASLRFGRVDIPGELAEDSAGVLLDIDLFSLHPVDAPTWSDALAWFDRAHAAENLVFEASITPEFRSELDRPRGEHDARRA